MKIKKSKFVFFAALVMPLLLSVFSTVGSSSAHAAITRKGHPECGGVVNGKLQASCNLFSPAKFESKAVPDCPAGTFFDIGKWSCWSCPPGYSRTGGAVDKGDACAKTIPAKRTRAKFLHRTGCPAGTFLDLRNGGECWSCPAGYGRTGAAVNEWNACGKIFKPATRAIYHGKSQSCGGNGFYDPRNGGECWSCPTGTQRTAFPVNGSQACETPAHQVQAKAVYHNAVTCPPGQIFDFIDGGTCWSCPQMYVRTMESVKSPKACHSTQISWIMPERTVPGFFGFPGAADIAKSLLADPQLLDRVLGNIASTYRADPGSLKIRFRKELQAGPQNSPLLASMVLLSALDHLAGKKTSTADRSFLSALENFIRETRIITATEALAAYDNWLEARQLYDRKFHKGSLSTLYHLGYVPPDFNSMASQILGGSAGVAMAGGVAAGTIGAMTASSQAAFVALNAVSQTVAEAVFPNVVAATASGAAGSTIGTAAAMAGPLAVVAGAAVVGGLALDHVIKAQEARPKLVAALNNARRPVDISSLMKGNGLAEIVGNWAAAVATDHARPDRSVTNAANVYLKGGKALPPAGTSVNKLSLSPSSTENLTKSTVKWTHIPGDGFDIGVGADGTAWIIGRNDSIYRMQGGKWSLVPGSATRISVGPHGRAWVVNKKGRIFKFTGTQWTSVPGTASDISVSSDGAVWVVGANDTIYRRTGSKWVNVPGSASRIAAGTNGTAWCVNRNGEIFHYDGDKWISIPGKASDISVGAGGTAWVIGGKDNIYRWNGHGWEQIPGSGVAIAGSNNGKAWVVNRNHQIFAGN